MQTELRGYEKPPPPPRITVTADKPRVTDDDHWIEFQLERNFHPLHFGRLPLSHGGVVNVRVTLTGDDQNELASYQQQVRFRTGARFAELEMYTGDLSEGWNRVTVQVLPGNRYAVGDPGAATVTGPGGPQVSIAAVSPSVSESEGGAAFLLTRAPTHPLYPLTVNVQVSGPHHLMGGDQPATVEFAAGSAVAVLFARVDNDRRYEQNGHAYARVEPGDGYRVGDPSSADARVIDDDRRRGNGIRSNRRITVAALNRLVTEGVDAVTFRLSRSGRLDESLRVGLDATGSAHVLGANPPAAATFPAGVSTVDVSVPVTGDNAHQPRGGSVTLAVKRSPGNWYGVGHPSTATVIVLDDDAPTPLPTRPAPPEPEPEPEPTVVTIAADRDIVRENEGPATFTLTRTGSTVRTLRVQLGMTTYGPPRLQSPLPLTATFAPGEDTATLSVGVTNNNETDRNNGIRARLLNGRGYTVGSPGEASLIVADDEPPVVTILYRRSSPEADESEGDLYFTLLRRGDITDRLTVSVQISENVVENTGGGSMLGFNVPSTATFPAGSYTAQLRVPLHNDGVYEENSVVTVDLNVPGRPSHYRVGVPGKIGITVYDDDKPVVTITADRAEVSEAEGSVSFTLHRAGDASQALKVNIFVSEDHNMLVLSREQLPTMVTFAAGSRTAKLRLDVNDDDEAKSHSEVRVGIDPGDDYEPGDPSSAGLRIFDDETTPVVSVHALFTSVSEGREGGMNFNEFLFELRRTGGNVSEDLDVTYSITQVGQYVHHLSVGTNTVGFDENFITEQIDVSILVNSDAEADGSVTLTLKARDDYVISATHGSATVTITDDDGTSGSVGPSQLSQLPANPEPNQEPQFIPFVSEVDIPENSPGGTNVGEPMTATDPDGDTLTYSLSGTGSERFAIDASGQIKVAPGAVLDHETTASYSILVQVDDGRNGFAGAILTINVTDVPENPVFIHAYKRAVDENSPAGTPVGVPVTATDPEGNTVTYTLTGPDAALFTIDANGQIKVGQNTQLDHETTPEHSVTVNAADGAGGTASVNIMVNVRDVAENRPPEFYRATTRRVDENSAAGTNVGARVRATDPDGDTVQYSLSGTGAALFTIDGNGQIKVAAGASLDYETTPSYAITVHADDGKGGTASVNITVSVRDVDETNYPPQFIHAIKRGVFENSAAGTNVGAPVTANDPNGDAITYSLTGTGSDLFTIDGNGQIKVGAGTSLDHETTPSYAITVHASDGKGGTASVTITVNVKDVEEEAEQKQLPTVSVVSATGGPESGSLTFGLERTGDASEALTVNVSVSETGNMLASNPPTAADFAAGSATTTLSVELDDDAVDEADSTVTLTLQAGDGYDVGSSSAATLVTDDDLPTVTIEADGASVSEAAGPATFTLTRNGVLSETLTVNVGISETGSMLADTQPATAIFAAGSATATLPTALDDDGADEPDSVVTATVAAGGGYEVGNPSSATATVTDDDLPAVTIESDGASVSEAAGPATFTLTRNGVLSETLTVNVGISETGSMLADTQPATAIFAAGSATATLPAALDDDGVAEPDSVVTATVADGEDYTVSGASAATVTVTDDEPAFFIYHDPNHSPEAVNRFNTARELLNDAEWPYSVRHVSGDYAKVDQLAKVSGTIIPRFFLGDPEEPAWGPSQPQVNNGGLRWLRSVLE